MAGSAAWPSDSGAGHGNLLQHPLELGAVTVVPGCQNEPEGPASSLGGEVDFGGEAAAGASQAFADLITSSEKHCLGLTNHVEIGWAVNTVCAHQPTVRVRRAGR
ncbi:hypothetical protein HOK021_35630 [Streptomyces hygroscopicus]|nr:hypothetical protein HOK021_35630 [Streptomyces hygroscopicus]